MEFKIKQNSTLPALKYKLDYSFLSEIKNIESRIKNAVITFSMIRVENSVFYIANRSATIEVVKYTEPCAGCDPADYYLVYNWTIRDTRASGQYKGEFNLEFLDDEGGSYIFKDIRIFVEKSITPAKSTAKSGLPRMTPNPPPPLEVLVEPKTYEELSYLKNMNRIVKGKFYILSDYQAFHYDDEGNTFFGGYEPLMLLGADKDKFDVKAVSTIEPKHIIHYDFDQTVSDYIAECDCAPDIKGKILYRKDTVNSIEAYFDWYVALTENFDEDKEPIYTFGQNVKNVQLGYNTRMVTIGENSYNISIGEHGSKIHIPENSSNFTFGDNLSEIDFRNVISNQLISRNLKIDDGFAGGTINTIITSDDLTFQENGFFNIGLIPKNSIFRSVSISCLGFSGVTGAISLGVTNMSNEEIIPFSDIKSFDDALVSYEVITSPVLEESNLILGVNFTSGVNIFDPKKIKISLSFTCKI